MSKHLFSSTKTKKIHVPKDIITEYREHPEDEGYKIAVFENGMWTDIFLDDDGTIFTLTNDDGLIDYLVEMNTPSHHHVV